MANSAACFRRRCNREPLPKDPLPHARPDRRTDHRDRRPLGRHAGPVYPVHMNAARLGSPGRAFCCLRSYHTRPPEIAAQRGSQRPRNNETRPGWAGFSMPFCSEALSGSVRRFSVYPYKHTKTPRNGPQKASSGPVGSLGGSQQPPGRLAHSRNSQIFPVIFVLCRFLRNFSKLF
jgi:hypothetical protein